MRCNGFKGEKFFGQEKCKEFLAFSSLEVRFLVDSSSCSNNKSLTNAKVEHLWNTVFLRLDALEYGSRSNYTRRTHTYMRIILTTVTGLELGLFVLYNSFPWLTAELRGCVYYCRHLTVVAVSLARTLSSHPRH